MWLFQLFDYVVKALVHYRETPEGAKEWNDFVSAFETASPDLASTFTPRPSASAPTNSGIPVQRSAPTVVAEKSYINTTDA